MSLPSQELKGNQAKSRNLTLGIRINCLAVLNAFLAHISISDKIPDIRQPLPLLSTLDRVFVMDTADLLTGALGGLQISNETGNQDAATFSLFPNFPLEIRQSIYKQALPPSTPVQLNAHVLVSDPAFGLYLTFSVSANNAPYSSFAPPPPRGHLTENLQRTRMTVLLLTTKETRAFYLSAYPQAMPSGPKGKSRIRISRDEPLYIDNFYDLTLNADFREAILGGYRLQDWWLKLESFAILFGGYLIGRQEHFDAILVHVIRKMEDLKSFNAVTRDPKWCAYHTPLPERVRSSLGTLERMMVNGYPADIENGYRLPEFRMLRDDARASSI